MSQHNLEGLFNPQSVAVVGASEKPRKVGSVVMANLLAGGFQGPILPVNPKYESVVGIRAYHDVSKLPQPPDLAVLCTPPSTIPGLVSELAGMGTRVAVVCTAGLSSERDEGGRPLDRVMMEGVDGRAIRILGPNCVGMIAPHAGLNASFAQGTPEKGRIAFVSQSGAMCTAVLGWSVPMGIGFSAFVSIGDSLDIDFGDVIDYLASDPKTRAILLYIESVGGAREFLSAARAASRNKPVVAIKAGRIAEGERAAASHTGALAGSDEVYDYALRRAGVLRVDRIDELFDAAETLDRFGPSRSDRLTILTNGGGPGVMATDALVRGGGRPTELSAETLHRLDEILPATWSHGNPIDIVGDADAERYRTAIRAVLAAPEVDALLVVHAPTALLEADDAARAVAEASEGDTTRVLTAWLGAGLGRASIDLLGKAGVAAFDSPEDGVLAFLHMARYRANRELLMRTPASIPGEIRGDRARAGEVIRRNLREGRAWLTEVDAKEVLKAYGLPVLETRLARDGDEAAILAEEIGFPVALKLQSPDVLHKTDVGGVVLDLETGAAVRDAASKIAERLEAHVPGANLEGFSVQSMERRPEAYELYVGAAVDPIFGPFIAFGEGGTAVEIIHDTALALPPLDMLLAEELVSRTRISRRLEGYRGRAPANREALYLALMRVSQMLLELPEVVELDVNPLLCDASGTIALDARMRVANAATSGEERFAIRPRPTELDEELVLPSGRRVLVRPIRPEDESSHRRLFEEFSPEDLRFRFFHLIKELPHSEMARYTQIDYDREMTFIAVDTPVGPSGRGGGGAAEELGVVRAILDPDDVEAEFAIIVSNRAKGEGLGRVLLEKMIRYLEWRGTETVVGRVLTDNQAMLGLARSLGFEVARRTDDNELEVRLALGDRA